MTQQFCPSPGLSGLLATVGPGRPCPPPQCPHISRASLSLGLGQPDVCSQQDGDLFFLALALALCGPQPPQAEACPGDCPPCCLGVRDPCPGPAPPPGRVQWLWRWLSRDPWLCPSSGQGCPGPMCPLGSMHPHPGAHLSPGGGGVETRLAGGTRSCRLACRAGTRSCPPMSPSGRAAPAEAARGWVLLFWGISTAGSLAEDLTKTQPCRSQSLSGIVPREAI